MCNTLQQIILDHTYCRILHPPLIFNISPLDNNSMVAKYIKLPVTINSCVDLYVPVTDNARSADISIIC